MNINEWIKEGMKNFDVYFKDLAWTVNERIEMNKRIKNKV
jgi:hypothetical protein